MTTVCPGSKCNGKNITCSERICNLKCSGDESCSKTVYNCIYTGLEGECNIDCHGDESCKYLQVLSNEGFILNCDKYENLPKRRNTNIKSG